MKSGLLWYDNSPKPLTEKIEGAAKRYREKFGRNPDTCFVNPLHVDAQTPASVPALSGDAGGVEAQIAIGTKATIMPNHLWLGVQRAATLHDTIAALHTERLKRRGRKPNLKTKGKRK